MKHRFFILVLVLSLVGAACSSGNKAETCEELAIQTIEHLQDLIDGVDDQFESMTIEEFIANGDNLPPVESFRAASEAIDKRSEELGCSQAEITAAVGARVGQLTARTQLGRFVINLLVSGNV